MARTEMPIQVPFVEAADPRDPKAANLPKLKMAFRWVQFWDNYISDVDKAPRRQGTVTLANQNASIATTPIPMPSLPPGLYRLSYYLTLTGAAGVSSSVTPTFRWTHGVAKSFAGAAMNGNTLTTYQQGTVDFRIDENAPVSYETVYASNPAGVARYLLDVSLETLSLDGAA